MSLKQQLEADFSGRENWALRRQKQIPNNRRLWICACMDERLPVDDCLGIRADHGDAHLFRNAGGLITDDAIRSAMLTCNFFGTTEIVIINHTECGMMSYRKETAVEALSKLYGDLSKISVDPFLGTKLKMDAGAFGDWIRLFDDVDEVCAQQVELVRNHPLIPKHVSVSGWIYEVETGNLRPPHRRVGNKVNTTKEMGAK